MQLKLKLLPQRTLTSVDDGERMYNTSVRLFYFYFLYRGFMYQGVSSSSRRIIGRSGEERKGRERVTKILVEEENGASTAVTKKK